jgi:ferrochelatase
MLFENLVSLIDGELLNEPSIASFSNVVFDAKKVKRGDLYLGASKDIDEALKNGAYGIVSTSLKIKDDEIAWIKVKSIQNSKLKLLRYLIIRESVYTLYVDCVKVDIIKSISGCKEILFIEDVEEAIRVLSLNSSYKLILFLDEKLFKGMELESFKVEIFTQVIVQKATIFLTTFIYHNRLYKDIKISELFISELEYILNLFDSLEIEYSLEKLSFISHFKPLFLDSAFRILNFGQSTKVVILESKKELLERELEFLKKKAPWAKMTLLLPKNMEFYHKNDIDIKYFKNFDDIKKLNIFDYNFVMMLDIEQKFLKYLIKASSNMKNSLF